MSKGASTKIAIEPTATTTIFNGQPVRVWHGVTDQGIPCLVFVASVAADERADLSAFEQALQEIPTPAEARPLRDFCPGR